MAGANFFAAVPAVRARGPRHHFRGVCRCERHHAGRARGAVHLWRDGGERLCFVRDRRRREASAVAQPPCSQRSGARFHRPAQAQFVRDRRALPRGSRHRLRGLCRLRMEARAARPLHGGKPRRVRPLSAAHAMHRGLLRRHARRPCRVVDVAVPALRGNRDTALSPCRRSPIRAIRSAEYGANRKAAICSTWQRTSGNGSPIL